MHALHPYRRTFSKEEINLLPLGQYEGKIVLVRDDAALSKAMACLSREGIIGFDTETKPAFTKGVRHLPSLVQLADRDTVYLIFIKKLKRVQELKMLFENPAVLKAGVALKEDLRKLRKVFTFEPAGFVDLQQMAEYFKLRTRGLRAMAGNLLGFRISKAARCSNWARKRLTQKQMKYAATDAWVSRELCLFFHTKGFLSHYLDDAKHT